MSFRAVARNDILLFGVYGQSLTAGWSCRQRGCLASRPGSRRILYPPPRYPVAMMLLDVHDAVAALAQRAARRALALNRTQIVKLLYFVDLFAMQSEGIPVTSIDWTWYDHGPFDKAIYAALDVLVESGELNHEVATAGSFTEHSYIATAIADETRDRFGDLTLIDEVLDRWGSASGSYLKELSYTTLPMIEAVRAGQRGVHLDLCVGTAVGVASNRFLLAMPLSVDGPDGFGEELLAFTFEKFRQSA
jgi:uncharacterized phage-associated protein